MSQKSTEDQLYPLPPKDLTTGVTGVLPVANGGTGGADDENAQPNILPQHTTTTRDLLSVSAGFMVYNTTTNKYNFYNGAAWEVITSA